MPHESSGLFLRAFLVFTGSPFTVKISGEGRVKESITRTSRAPSVATVGSSCDLNLKIPGEHEQLMSQAIGCHSSETMSELGSEQVLSGGLFLNFILLLLIT